MLIVVCCWTDTYSKNECCVVDHVFCVCCLGRCFRLSDLEIGGVIGQGFYGAVTKVFLIHNAVFIHHLLSLSVSFQVRHRYTGQEMVMKEMAKVTDETKISFLQEVTYLTVVYD